MDESDICVICRLDNLPFASLEEGCYVCKCNVHSACMTQWLVSTRGNGSCPHCRSQIKPKVVTDLDLESDDDEPIRYGNSSWIEPFGYIDVSLSENGGSASVTSTTDNISVCIVQGAEIDDFLHDWDHSPERLDTVAIIVDSGYQYVDSLNIPAGWILRVFREGNPSRSFIKINHSLVAELDD